MTRWLGKMLRRGHVHGIGGQLAALEARVDAVTAPDVVPLVVAHGDGHVTGYKRTWPSLEAMYSGLSGKQSRMPLVIQLAVDGPETAKEDR